VGIPEFVAGWVLGAKAGNKGFDEVLSAGRSILESKEFADFTAALRTHAAYALHEMGDLLDVDHDSVPGEDILDIVRKLVERREEVWTAARRFPRPPRPDPEA
jgi:hypothetical protein